MVREVLLHIADGSGASFRELAERLDVDRGALEAMLGELERKGYLRREAAGACSRPASSHCGGACGSPGAVSWALTDKARRTIGR